MDGMSVGGTEFDIHPTLSIHWDEAPHKYLGLSIYYIPIQLCSPLNSLGTEISSAPQQHVLSVVGSR